MFVGFFTDRLNYCRCSTLTNPKKVRGKKLRFSERCDIGLQEKGTKGLEMIFIYLRQFSQTEKMDLVYKPRTYSVSKPLVYCGETSTCSYSTTDYRGALLTLTDHTWYSTTRQ